MPPQHQLADLVQIEIPAQDLAEAGAALVNRRRRVGQLRKHIGCKLPDKAASAFIRPCRTGNDKQKEGQDYGEARRTHDGSSRFHWAGRVSTGGAPRLKSGRGGG